MKEPLISIIIPIYKAEKSIERCIESIVNQTYKNIEIILVDDGSPDNCPAICDEWAKRDERIKVIHKENAGAAAARNSALDIAKGDYFGFVDSDDYIDVNMYNELISAILSTGKKIAHCDFYRVFLNGSTSAISPKFKKDILNTEETINEMFRGKVDTSVWSKLFERSVFSNIRFPEKETNEEFPILIPLFDAAGGIVHISKPLYYYCVTEGSVTTTSVISEKYSGLIHKNLKIMKKQFEDLNFNCDKSYAFFAASYALYSAITMEKKYKQLTPKLKEDYKVYRKIMKKNLFAFIFSKNAILNDKILYILILTKLLRPMYKLFYKNHL